jgi:AraC-like DNA-binding protein
MNTYNYSYPAALPGGSFDALASAFESKISNGIIDIPSKRGYGQIRQFTVSPGLCINTWNVLLNHPLHLKRIPNNNELERTFSLFFSFNPGAFIINNNNNAYIGHNKANNILLASDETDLMFTITPQNYARIIAIDITESWLAKECTIINPFLYSFYSTLMTKEKPVLFTETLSFVSYHSLLDVFTNIVSGYPDPLFMRRQVISILSSFFIPPDNQEQQYPVKKSNALSEKMILVEKILDDHINSTLPSLSSIARQVAISESTLKRNFKTLYGVSIYEYYLRKKMQKARQLFTEKSLTVKEVAYMLGYEKVSNFIQMFKKHHNLSPGQMKKLEAEK